MNNAVVTLRNMRISPKIGRKVEVVLIIFVTIIFYD
jgi:hypothetical protein